MCNNCIHKAVCSIYRATGGVKKCEHFYEVIKCKDCAYRHDSCFAGKGNTYCDLKHTYFKLNDGCASGKRGAEDGK